MPKISAHRQSATAVVKAAKTLKTQCNKTWNLAPKAPMFTRKSKTASGKKKVVRTKRLIGGHAYKICASGAAGWVNSVMQREANAFRTSIRSESKRVPWLPSVGKGAIALIEQFLCAYAQEATRHAVSVRQGLGRVDKKTGKHLPMCTRLTGKLMKLGYDTADAAIFANSMPAPRMTIVCKPDQVAKKDEKKEEEGKEAPQAE
jgi:hypothetical protein